MKLIDLLVQELPKRGGWPEGSVTAWQSTRDGEVYFFKENGGYAEENNGGRKWYFEIARDRGEKHTVTREQYEAELAAAQQPVWDGEGLPPVGTICEYQTSSNGNLPVRIECVTQDGVAFTWLGGHDQYKGLDCISAFYAAKYFKPIRSEADKRRDEAIAALKKLKPQLVGELAGYLYDEIAAGKIPHIRIEQAA